VLEKAWLLMFCVLVTE